VLASRGHQVLLYDARRSAPSTGGGIMIRPNGSRLFTAWGLGSFFAPICDESPSTAFYNLETGAGGERRQAVDVSQWPDWGLNRRQAWNVLHEAATRVGVQVKWGTAIDGFMARGDRVRVRLHGARMEDVDLVLDATGAHSKLRPAVLGIPRDQATTTCNPRIVQGTAYSVSVKASQIASHPDARDLLSETTLKVWMGGKDRYVVQRYHEKNGEVSLLCFVSDDETQDMKGFWDEDGDIEHLRSIVKGRMAPALWACLETADHCARWKFCEMPNLDHWVGKNGRIALLGDSAQ
jgi:salicylate hydroxylase